MALLSRQVKNGISSHFSKVRKSSQEVGRGPAAGSSELPPGAGLTTASSASRASLTPNPSLPALLRNQPLSLHRLPGYQLHRLPHCSCDPPPHPGHSPIWLCTLLRALINWTLHSQSPGAGVGKAGFSPGVPPRKGGSRAEPQPDRAWPPSRGFLGHMVF